MKSKIFFLILIITVILSGCLDKTPAEIPVPQNKNITVLEEVHLPEFIQPISVIHDNVRNVTCWREGINNGGGLSCLPDNQINKAT